MIAAENHEAPPPVVVTVEPVLVGSAVAAAMTGLSQRSWQRMASAGETPTAIKISGKSVWRVDELRAWAAAGAPSRARWEALESSRQQAAPGIDLERSPAADRAGSPYRSPP